MVKWKHLKDEQIEHSKQVKAKKLNGWTKWERKLKKVNQCYLDTASKLPPNPDYQCINNKY